MITDYFRLAYRGVMQRKLRSWLTMIGIFIGIAAVVALISLSQGMQYAIEQQFVSLGSDKLIVQAAGFGFGPPGTAVSNPLTVTDKEAIEKVKGVEVVIGRLARNVRVEFKKEVKFAYIASIPDKGSSEEIDLIVEANNYKIEQGRLLKSGDKYKVMIGYDFSEDFFDKKIELRDKVKVQDQFFEVVGILKKSGNPQQDSTFVIPETAMREILNLEKEYDVIPLKIKSGENIEQVAEDVKKKLRDSRNVKEGKEDFSVETPGSILATLTTILLIVQGVLIGIASISLLVGGIGIMNTMYTAVLERTKEIGIMKALGARRENILLLFLIESGVLGLIGGIIGAALGMSISKLVELVAFQIYGSFLIQANFNPLVIIGALLFAFLVGALSGVFPARQAALLKPVDALRK
ncbi:MAG: ABC transporter permease [Nanoarchaeota archaeon]|nr:ABC transporter permease [Nanoarchaeota archaeon]MBU1643532.1 ABC transporter permease [Nanoarchaeota archaeon]MBU1977376.1 ABC transporter permease [Nanoarchaeota archaeon]